MFLYIINNALVLGIIILFTLVTSQYFVISHDDMCNCFIDKNHSLFYTFFYNVYHGRYISNIITKFQGCPFGIHPNVYIRTYGAILKAIFTFIIFFLLASSLFLFDNKSKNNIFKYICLPLTALACYFIYHFDVYLQYEELLYSFFYGFMFPFIFFILFWNKFIYIYTYNLTLTKKDYYYLCILAFLLGISTEITIFVSFVSLVLILICDLLKRNNNSKQFIVPIIILFISSLFYVLNPGFIYRAHELGTLNGFKNMIETAINSLNEYFILCSTIIKDYFSECTLFIISLLIMVIICKYYKNKTNFVKIVLSLFVSNYLFWFLLIFAGRNPDNILYVGHHSTNVQILFCFVYILFITISYVSKNNLIKGILIFIFIAFGLFYKSNFINHINYIMKTGIKNHLGHGGNFFSKTRYKTEAILLYYATKKEKAIIPDNRVGFYINLSSYLDNVYNIKDIEESSIILTNEAEAYNEYLKNGGRIITEEEIEKSDFQLLKTEYTQK